MFKKLMNSYYFGKAGKSDLTPEDLPETRWQLFLETFRTHFSMLFRLNLMYVVVWIPALIVLFMGLSAGVNQLMLVDIGDGTSIQTQMAQEERLEAEASGNTETAVQQAQPVLTMAEVSNNLRSVLLFSLLLMVPFITITGPATSGICYITRNWSRDEHAFMWSDFKDAVKANWKQSIVISFITSLLPLLVYLSWTFYGGLIAEGQAFMVVPQMLVVLVGVIWAISVTYMHPLIVSYELKLRDVIRNGLLMGVARLPFSIGIRLLHMVPTAIAAVMFVYWNPPYGMLFFFLWYVLFGFACSRFITASYTNAVFDRFINSRIEGAVVNRGLREQDPDEDDEDDEETES